MLKNDKKEFFLHFFRGIGYLICTFVGLLNKTMDYSKHSFERLYKANYRQMYRLAYLIVEDAEDARDAVSQVFAQLWQLRPAVDDKNLTAYLLTAARNQSLHIVRQRGLREEMEERFLREQQLHDDKEHEELMAELRQLVDENLTPRARQVLALHFDEELTYKETAKALGISPSAVNKHITLSLEKLRKKLNG